MKEQSVTCILEERDQASSDAREEVSAFGESIATLPAMAELIHRSVPR